jgi:iron-sulfur cluster repair protein YtfE (RIC family)
MNIYQKLKREHDDHRELMRRIAETTGETDERKRLFDLLIEDVESHAAAEEQTLYSELIEATEGQPQTRHSVSEHKQSSDYLEELKGTDMSSPAWLATFKKFREDLEHHMREEEQKVFELSEELIDDERADELGGKFDRRKQVEQRRFRQ